jgi:hypothetical protein
MTAPPRDRSYWSRVLLALVMAVFLIVCMAGLIAVARKPTAIFNVTVTTERLAFERPLASRERWTFQGARLETAGKIVPSFTGSIELDKRIRGFIERIGEGPLWVHVECMPPAKAEAVPPSCAIGRVFDDKDALLMVAGGTLDVWIDNVKQAAERGITTVLTLSGTITPGREVGMETLGSTAILREGSVAVLVETAFGEERFEARREALEAGDLFRVVDPDPRNPTDGFVVADERPALTAAYRVGGARGHRQRPGGGGYDVVATTYQRIVHDEFFQLLSWVLVFLAGLAAVGQLAASLKPDGQPSAATVATALPASAAQPQDSGGAPAVESGDR